jgi:hypothetical protein
VNGLQFLCNLWNFTDFFSVGGFRPFAFPAFGLLDLVDQVGDALDGHYLLLNQFLPEHLDELLVL